MKLRQYVKSAEKCVRQGRVHAMACARELAWVRTRLNLPRNDFFTLENSPEAGVEVRTIEPARAFERTLPFMPAEHEPHETFLKLHRGTFPASVVAELRGGRFWGFYGGSVFTRDDRLVPDLSKDVWGPQLHSALVRGRWPSPRKLSGLTLSLVTPEAAANYHHWTIDLLPRAGLVQRAGYRLSDFDQILIKDRGLPFQKEAYRRLGIDEKQLVRVDDRLHIQAERLVVPSIRHDVTLVPGSDFEFIRKLYLPEEPAPELAHRRLYVGRRDAAFRRVTNEEALLKMLVGEYGFEEVAMSEMSVADQAKLFSEAQMLIGPNGSALANMVFANRACRVVEFFAPGWVVGFNWMIGSHLKLPYAAVVGEGPRPPPGTLPRELKDDITLDLDALKTAIEMVRPRAVA